MNNYIKFSQNQMIKNITHNDIYFKLIFFILIVSIELKDFCIGGFSSFIFF